MISTIQPMDVHLKNIFPAVLEVAAGKIFDNQPMQPVLLELLSAPAASLPSRLESSLSMLLHPNEAEVFNGYRFPKRRSEYLTGRICAKMAVDGFLQRTQTPSMPLSLSEIEIARTADGRPEVRLDNPETKAPQMDISISHGGEYGAALAAHGKCGIDVQLRQAGLLRVRKKYCSEGDYNLLETSLPARDPLTRLAVLWAAKEAAKKALSHWHMPGFLDLVLCRLENLTNCMVLVFHITQKKRQVMPAKVTVATDMFGEYSLALCLVDEDCSDAGTARG